MSESTSPDPPVVSSPPPAEQPERVEPSPPDRLHQLMREYFRTRDRKLMFEYLRTRSSR
jgi:hypothetical protein